MLMTLAHMDELKKRYPQIFRSDFFFEIPDRWFGLIDGLCAALMKREGPPPRAFQVKESYGRLCFYCDGTTAEHDALITVAEDLTAAMPRRTG